MSTKTLLALLLNVAAVLLPPLALYWAFGLDARVDPQDAKYVLPLGGAMVASFAAGLLSSRLVSVANGFAGIFASLTKALQADASASRPSAKRAA